MNRNILIMQALVVAAAAVVAGCGKKESVALPEAGETKPSVEQTAAVPQSVAENPAGVAASRPQERPAGEVEKAPAPAPSAAKAVSPEMAELQRKFSDKRVEMVSASKAQQDAQEKAFKSNIELSDLKTRLTDDRKAIMMRIESLPEIVKLNEDREAKQRELRELLNKKNEMRNAARAEGVTNKPPVEFLELQKRSSVLSREVNVLQSEIEMARRRARTENPEIKAMQDKLVADEKAMKEKLAETPDIKALREKMMSLHVELVELEKQMAALKKKEAAGGGRAGE